MLRTASYVDNCWFWDGRDGRVAQLKKTTGCIEAHLTGQACHLLGESARVSCNGLVGRLPACCNAQNSALLRFVIHKTPSQQKCKNTVVRCFKSCAGHSPSRRAPVQYQSIQDMSLESARSMIGSHSPVWFCDSWQPWPHSVSIAAPPNTYRAHRENDAKTQRIKGGGGANWATRSICTHITLTSWATWSKTLGPNISSHVCRLYSPPLPYHQQ